MKKILTVAMAIIIACGSVVAQERDMKQVRKERQEIVRLSRKDLNARCTKAARKEAKALKKAGWKVSPGALPLEKQLDRAYLMEMEYDANLYPKYIIASAQSIGENYDAAKTAALSLAITNLAGQIQTEVTALVENTVANKQLSANEAASIVETVQASKNLISQSIGRTLTIVDCYREVKNGNKEVLVRIAYNGDMAKEAARNAVREELQRKGDDLHDQLDRALGF